MDRFIITMVSTAIVSACLVIGLCLHAISIETNKDNKVMNIQEEFDKLSPEDKWDFLVRNLDEQTAIDAVFDNDVRLEKVAYAYPYDAVQEFILDYAEEYGVKIDYEATRDM